MRREGVGERGEEEKESGEEEEKDEDHGKELLSDNRSRPTLSMNLSRT